MDTKPDGLLDEKEIKSDFYNLKTFDDLAQLLEIESTSLFSLIDDIDRCNGYNSFCIPKKSGGYRSISSPKSELKVIQRRLNSILQVVANIESRENAYGFVRGTNIVSNAIVHQQKKYVFNVDISNFFPSINFKRVKGLFTNYPYQRSNEVSESLAKLCCYKNVLPQGAPTSPVISNMICYSLDKDLQILANTYACDYTRYADDITFSTNRTHFPKEICEVNDYGFVSTGIELKNIILKNGFKVNTKKVRLYCRHQRQVVTGLTVNHHPNVSRKYRNQIRAMLHAWEKYGLEKAEEEYWEKYNSKSRNKLYKLPSFRRIVRGKIEYLGMVLGKDNGLYLKYLKQLKTLDPDAKVADSLFITDRELLLPPLKKPLIITEGKTDKKHLKAALNAFQLNGEYLNLDIDFYEVEVKLGNDPVKKMYLLLEKIPHDQKLVFIIDRDDSKVMNDLKIGTIKYKDGGNNAYIFAIPVPHHRRSNPAICIELYYSNYDLRRKDENGRRLYLSNEFNPDTGKHNDDKSLHTLQINALRKGEKENKIKIIEDSVFDNDDKNVALSKNNFAENILNKNPLFNDVDFSAFAAIFDIIQEIIGN